ncbi:hypothetical protein F4778DRAFT_293983 [Xylariomycetidae sp. FL2044]|nr:hypothetical protein F4778DRAFT_293983 [Xylariomycetidae sp. FL2044]
MMRLPATTISLTIAEVNEFERHSRFKKYLARDFQAQLPFRPRAQDPSTSRSKDHQHIEKQTPESGSEAETKTERKESPKPSEGSAQQPQNSNDSGGSSSQTLSTYTESSPSSSSMIPQMILQRIHENPSPIALPPPFSTEGRVVSDTHSLPSSVCPSRHHRLPFEADDLSL